MTDFEQAQLAAIEEARRPTRIELLKALRLAIKLDTLSPGRLLFTGSQFSKVAERYFTLLTAE